MISTSFPEGLNITSFPITIFLTILFLITLLYIHTIRTLRPAIPASIPWVGVNPNEYLSTLRAHRREWTQAIPFLADGYTRYNKRGKPFATPNSTFEPEVLLPTQHLPWLLGQGEASLSPFPVRDEVVGFRFLAPSVVCSDRALHDSVLLGPLTRKLGAFTARNAEVVARVLPRVWARGVADAGTAVGDGGEGWRGVEGFNTLQQVVAEMTALSFFGPALAGDATFVKALTRHGTLVAVSAGFSRLFAPPPVRFLVAPLVALPANVNGWYLGRWLIPVIKQKLDEAKGGGEKGAEEDAEQKTLLDFIVEASIASPDARNRDPKVVASRMLMILFAALNTTLFTIVWVLVHLQSAADHDEVMRRLRAEADATLASEPAGVWTRAKLAELKVHDSVIRETLRHTGFGGRGVMHEVIDRQGVQLPSGERLPKGTWVGVDVRDIHRDEQNYEKPEIWDGLRFLNRGDDLHAGKEEDKDHQDGLIARDTQTAMERKQRSLVTTSSTFLAFSHGRHACPGRFFAAHQMKLLLVQIVLHFDIKRMLKEVGIKFVTDFVVPPMEDLIWVKPRGGV